METNDSTVNLMKTDHYKVMVLLGCARSVMHTVEAVLDTGAGPNFVRESLLPPDWRKYSTDASAYPSIRDANNRRLKISGVVRMHVDIGGYELHTSFLVCRELAVQALLGCDFIQKYVEAILPQKRQVVLRYGGAVAIQTRAPRSVANVDMSKSPPPARDHPCPRKRRPYLGTERIKLAKPATLPPYSEVLIQVRGGKGGLQRIEPAERLMRKHKLSVPFGIIDPVPGRTFAMKLANFSSKVVRLRKGTIVCKTKERPKFVVGPLTEESGADQTDSTAPNDWEREVNLDHLDKGLRVRVLALLRKYSAACDGRLGYLKGVTHRIEITPGEKPIYQQPYRCGIERRKAEDAEVQRMLKAGVITPSNAEWASPVILVPKPDGSLRFCVDYRKLNSITVRDSYPMPRMDECIDSLGSATIFSTLDCNSGYWQLPVAEKDQAKTTFTCHSGSFKFVRLPFGLRNAPATFQRAMDIILSRVRWKSVLVYLDDIIVFSREESEHLRHLEQVLALLQEAGATLRLAKCSFFQKQVKYLGHIIRPGRLAIYGKNLEALEKALPPKNKTQVRSFLGMCNVYRRFIRDFTRIAHPLNQKVRKDAPQEWDALNEEETKAFNTLRRALLTAPILALPREGYKYTLDTDASDYQLGCCLLQEQPDGALHPIGYWSRALASAEKNYSSTEKECLALVWAVQHLRPYLEGQRFTLRTDHDALKWLMNLRSPSGRLTRWSLRLQEFDFDVVYKPGSTHALADGPSRMMTEGLDQSFFDDEIPCMPRYDERLLRSAVPEPHRKPKPIARDEELIVNLLRREELNSPISVDEMLAEQAVDSFCQHALRHMSQHPESPFAYDQHGVVVRRAALDGRLQIVVPSTLRKRLLRIAHHAPVTAHPGRSKMFETLRRDFYWPSMSVDIHHVVEDCDTCARNRGKEKRNEYPMKLFPATRPLEHVAMDILGPLPRTKHGKRFILVVTDRFTKLTKTESLRTITSLSVAKAFCQCWIFNYGIPKTVLTDNGSQFTAGFFRTVCRILGIHKVFTTEYHPQTNGQAERYNRTLLAALRNFVSDSQRDWDEWLGPVTYAYNTQVHRSTGTTPFDLVLSRPPSQPLVDPGLLEHRPVEYVGDRRIRVSQAKQAFLERLDHLVSKARRNLERTQARYKRNADARIRQRLGDLTPGDYVYREIPEHPQGVSPKLASPVEGPYKVLSTDGPTIVIEVRGHPVRVNANRLVRAPTPRRSGIQHRLSLPDVEAQPARGSSVGNEVPASETTRPQPRIVPPSKEGEEEERLSVPHPAAQPGRGSAGGNQGPASMPPGTQPTQNPNRPRARDADPQGSRRAAQRRSTQEQRRYEIEKLVGAGLGDDGQELYRVRWLGYPPSSDTWEPANHLPRELVRAYKRRHHLS